MRAGTGGERAWGGRRERAGKEGSGEMVPRDATEISNRDVPGGVLAAEHALRHEVFLHGEHVEAGGTLVQVALAGHIAAAGRGVRRRARVRGRIPAVGRSVGARRRRARGSSRDDRAVSQRGDPRASEPSVRLVVPHRALGAGECRGSRERRHGENLGSSTTPASLLLARFRGATPVPAAAARRSCARCRFKSWLHSVQRSKQLVYLNRPSGPAGTQL